MSGAIQLTEVDFDEIKENLVDYLKSTQKFTDFDFDGSNLSVILNLIAYQAQLNAYSTNMVANESFLSSSTIRKNVVSNARQIGYTPNSTQSSQSTISFSVNLSDLGPLNQVYPGGLPQSLVISPGNTFRAYSSSLTYNFNLLDEVSASVDSSGGVLFENVTVFEGDPLQAKFTVDLSDYNQRFVLDNSSIDYSTLRVYVQEDPNEVGQQIYTLANNITEVNNESRVYWIEEVEVDRYEITFGDGSFGRKLSDGAVITVNYLTTAGEGANGVQGTGSYVFVGRVNDSFGTRINLAATTLSASISSGGSDAESIASIKLRAPKSYSSQNRCVTPQDYENVIRNIYPGVEDVYVYGGETLDIPEYGRVYVVIKPLTSDYLSVSTKNYIKKSLDNFRVASLDVIIQDPEVLYIEVESLVYYDDKKTNKDPNSISTDVKETLTEFAQSSIVSRFGGSVKYSRIVGVIDDSDDSITRNTTSLRMRKNVTVVERTAASYEICFDNPLEIDYETEVVYSTGFRLGVRDDSPVCYLKNNPPDLGQTKTTMKAVYFDEFGKEITEIENLGTLDLDTGEIMIGYESPITIYSTVLPNSVIEVRSTGRDSGKDIIAKNSVYLSLDIASSTIGSTVDRDTTGS